MIIRRGRGISIFTVLFACLLTLPLAVLTSCQSATEKAAKEPAREPVVGRYQMASTPTRTLKLDTATGQTWFLDTDSSWKPLTSADSVEKKTRVIAEFVAESLIATEKYSPETGKIEVYTEAERKQKVDEAVKQAFDTYEHRKTAEQNNDPLGIR